MSSREDNSRILAAAVNRLQTLRLQKCFTPTDPDSKPTAQQQAALDGIGQYRHRYVIGGNQSGKTMLGGRELTWVFQENHPSWQRPVQWVGPLTLLVVSRTSTITAEELWEKKIRPFLPSGEYKEHRNGGQLYKVTHPRNNNTMLFFSHHSPDEAREKLQAFTAHYVWLDEMPNSIKLIEELHRRVQANEGYFLATFTPKVASNDIRKLVDTPTSIHKKYVLHMMENPIYKGREDQELETMKTYTDAYRNTLLYGDWFMGDEAVYDFSDTNVSAPVDYHPSWRHVLAVDPASSGKAGLVLLAENPATHVWYVMKAEYFNEPVATRQVETVNKTVAGYNVVKRVSDPHEAWFINQARAMGVGYVGVFKKNERKKDLIKCLQEKLHEGKLKVAPWCQLLIEEFSTCQWHESKDGKIVGASRFHLLDALQYGVDVLPKPSTEPVPRSFDEALKIANRKRKEKEAKAAVLGRLPRARIKAKRGRKVKVV